MTTSAGLLVDAFGRIQEEVHAAVAGLSADELAYRINGEANSIAWLIWHLARVQDDHVAGAAGFAQVWTAQGWAGRFDLPFGDSEIGYGQDSRKVAQVKASAELLTGYYDATHEQTIGYVKGLTSKDLTRIVDENWDPPVTLAVRLVSVVSDDLQHVGQAAFIRGLL
ncbi:putative damage-inducible protein DinB [Kibdelosporangium banguiense]|uniref:Damage-inducible protein DinB n=1 Tax=Kibdelosporangium banguiense TaxID=1365924 RepID=A0ABS4TZM6_9PSEU|nr:DUF664 domain-containing protein [Kibdelosporangium banguiense]MBP2329860.1 putative damage-inducible protein DinB [Kibdelosporangium banguiense]